MQTTIAGIDLAKNVFHVCLMNSKGRVLKKFRTSRRELFVRVLSLHPDRIAMECCGGSHYWARRFEKAGFDTVQIAAQFVKPFVKSNKNDHVDAEAICEAASREQMRYVATRTEEQQNIQNLHRIRARLVDNRTELANQIRGFLLECGIVVPQGLSTLMTRLPLIIEAEAEERGDVWRRNFVSLNEELKSLDVRIHDYQRELKQIASSHEICRQLTEIPGVGYLTATAVYAAVGDPSVFENGRQFAAWLGLVPRQSSTGGKARLGKISKRGNKYIRRLLVQGATSLAIAFCRKNSKCPESLGYTGRWYMELASRKSSKVASVALANKMARQIFAVLSGKDFKPAEKLPPLAA